MSAQRARSAVAADLRSAHPDFPGVPWWGAVLIAITATAIGFAFDAGAGSKQLSLVFAGCYVIGCVLAVLAVRQSAVFTAVIQPPLVLFASVPTAYFLFTSGQIEGLRDLAINCGYPLIERFPLMFFTSAGVLLIGMLRWYVGLATRRTSAARAEDVEDTDEPGTGFAAALTAKLSGLFGRERDEDEDDVEPLPPPRRRRPASERASTNRRDRATSARRARPAKRAAPSRSRHVRPPETEIIEPVAERPRRSRSSRQGDSASPEPRRRPRTSNPRQPGPPPSERRSRYDRNGYERPGYDRPERRRRFDDYEPREPHSARGTNGSSTHHPISRVRYRGEETNDRSEYRTRRRGGWEADSWEYDV